MLTKGGAAFLGEKGMKKKGKKRVELIISLIYKRVEDLLGGAHYKRSIKVDQMCKLIFGVGRWGL